MTSTSNRWLEQKRRKTYSYESTTQPFKSKNCFLKMAFGNIYCFSSNKRISIWATSRSYLMRLSPRVVRFFSRQSVDPINLETRQIERGLTSPSHLHRRRGGRRRRRKEMRKGARSTHVPKRRRGQPIGQPRREELHPVSTVPMCSPPP